MSSMIDDVGVTEEIRTIELPMMDPKKYYPLCVFSSLSIRTILYPISLIKTRLQIQEGKSVYKGTFDALYKIPKNEGITGLYRGFMFNTTQIIPTLCYIYTYENTRQFLAERTQFGENAMVKTAVAGGCASFVGQTISVPIDVVTQHLMLLGQKQKHKSKVPSDASVKLRSLQEIHISEELKRKHFGELKGVISHVYRTNGLKGFYKGYFVSLAVFAPNSALWWTFYDRYSELVISMVPDAVPRLPIQCVCAAMAGVSAATITNPLDLIRARMQVKGTSFSETYKILWREEHYKFVVKGLSARFLQSTIFSFFTILGYESLKRISLKEEYKPSVRW